MAFAGLEGLPADIQIQVRQINEEMPFCIPAVCIASYS